MSFRSLFIVWLKPKLVQEYPSRLASRTWLCSRLISSFTVLTQLSCLIPILIFIELSFLEGISSEARAQNRDGPLITNTRSLSSDESTTYDFSFGEELNRILATSAEGDIFDPLTLMNLQLMKEEAQPSWSREDVDAEKLRVVVQKTFAIQTARYTLPVIKDSELGTYYKSIERSIKSFTDLFNYSLQQSGSGLKVAKEKRGRKLAEFRLSLSPRSGLDPQIRIGDNSRLRYDWVAKRSMLEFGFTF